MKKILVVSQYFWPENFRVNELVLELKNRGYVVEVLTSTPNYPSRENFSDFTSNPDRYRDYFGIKVHRVLQTSRHNNKLRLAVNYLSFVITACLYSLFRLRKREFDFVFGVQLSPIFSMIPAILCKKIFRKPLQIWVLDIWPDSVGGVGIQSSWLVSALRKLCVSIYSSADVLFLSSKGFRYKLNEMGVTAPDMVYLPQWIEADYLNEPQLGSSEDFKVRQLVASWKNKIIFSFTGNIGEFQDFPNVLEGLKKCRRLNDLVFLVIGDGSYKTELIRKIQSEGLNETVFCLGQYPPHLMPFFYHYSDYLVVSLNATGIFSYTLPGKIQSYMSSGKPIIGMVNGETARCIDDSGCSYAVASWDVDNFARVLDLCCSLDPMYRRKLGRLGRKYAHEKFRLEPLVDRILENF